MRPTQSIFSRLTILASLAMVLSLTAFAQRGPSRPDSVPTPGARPPASPPGPPAIRNIDGTDNNRANEDWGTVGSLYLRITPAAYADGLDSPAESTANVRDVSNTVMAQDEDILNRRRVNDMFWQWGQFLDHDIDLTLTTDPGEAFDIEIPVGDVYFDPFASGTVTMPLDRSDCVYDDDGVRQQWNGITAYIDGSNIYGSDDERADELRANDGTGKLKTSEGDRLPFNTAGLANAGGTSDSLYLAGDVRANEQVGLLTMHTLFVREHNYWCDQLIADHPTLTGDQLYQGARIMVIAELQAITYREFLPLLIGRASIRPYRGYKPDVDAGISNEFATAAYRFGHSMVTTTLMRLDANLEEIPEGHLGLRDAFFSPAASAEASIDSVLRGLVVGRAQELDPYIVDDLRNFLFGPPGSGGFDLASLNLQRSRDHGLTTYAEARAALGLRPRTKYRQITRDRDLQAKLEAAYGTIGNIDLWVGILSENRYRGGMIGETGNKILADQFTRLRDGDRFWYEGYLPRQQVALINRTRLSDIIKRNTDIGRELGRNAFIIQPGRKANLARAAIAD